MKYRFLGLRILAGLAVLGALASGFVLLLGTAKSPQSNKLQVVAGENFWGDIASQIGGDRVQVTSIITDPTADPHLYESDAQTAAAVASARLVIVNGLGYDDFMIKLLGASSRSDRAVVTAADVVGLSDAAANPHLWYKLAYAKRVAAEVETQLAAADPAGEAAYRAGLQRFEDGLAPVEALVAEAGAKYAGAPVAYTERVPGYLLADAGLKVETPAGFARAIEDGVDPSPADNAAMEKLVTDRAVRVLLYNSQATSPATQRVRDLAEQSGVSVVGVSETMPSGATYQSWQTQQLKAILKALGS